MMKQILLLTNAIPFLSYLGTMALRLFPLLIGAIFLAELARSKLGEEKLRSILSSSRDWEGRAIAAALGAILPFCECGAFPVMVGLLKAGVSVGTVLTFFIISPIVSIPAFIILMGFFGFSVSLLYLVITMITGIAASIVLERLKIISFLKEDFFSDVTISCKTTKGISGGDDADKILMNYCPPPRKRAESIRECCEESVQNFAQKPANILNSSIFMAWSNTFNTFKKILPYSLTALIVASILYEYLPYELIDNILTSGAFYSVPLAALVGIPFYTGDSTMIAIIAPFLTSTGTIGPGVALIIAGTGTSINGLIFMSSIFKKKFLVCYTVTIFIIALITGYTMQFLPI